MSQTLSVRHASKCRSIEYVIRDLFAQVTAYRTLNQDKQADKQEALAIILRDAVEGLMEIESQRLTEAFQASESASRAVVESAMAGAKLAKGA